MWRCLAVAAAVVAAAVAADAPDVDFVCDGWREVSRLHVNDDYCDCDDGSDETATSACAHTSVAVRAAALHRAASCDPC
jgi:hypothetical protein